MDCYIHESTKLNFNYETNSTHAGMSWLIKINWDMAGAKQSE